MKIVTSDARGVRVMVDVAQQIQALLDSHNVGLAVSTAEGVNAVLVIAKAPAVGVAVTIEPNPRLVDPREATPPAKVRPKRVGRAHPPGEEHYASGSRDCLCIASCCSGQPNGVCICLTCEDVSHNHG